MVNVDFRNNPKIDRESLRKVALSLIKNVDLAKQNTRPFHKAWLKKDVLFMTKSEWPTLVRGLNLIGKDGEPESQVIDIPANPDIFNSSTALNLEVKTMR
jgi:hypothetical protein